MSAADPTKRALMTIGDSSEVLKKPEKVTGTGNGKSKSLRFDLDLFEPDEYKFPEFNYKKLVHNEKIEKKKQKKLAKLPNGNHNDPFAGDENDDVERITRELEAKYGSGTAYGSSSRLTLVDRGAGYDATDTFIDDTEAYDELIPDELEADKGGFYINSGSLEFKKLSNFERPGDEIRMPKAKKRSLSSSSESSAGEDAAGKERNLEKPKKKIHVEKKMKPTATSSSDETGKAKKQKKDKLEKQEKIEKPKEVVKEIIVVPAKEPEKKKTIEKESEKIHKTTTVKDMLRAKRDHMRKMEQGKPTSSGATTATENEEDEEGEVESVSSLAISDSSRDSHHEQAPTNGVKEIQLPTTLPSEVVSAIASFKQQAEASASAKTNFFNINVLDQLVKLDNSVKVIGVTTRVQVFNYLEQIVPCSKKALFAKVRKHRVNQFESKVKAEINKLRKIVNETMTAEIANHDIEMMKYEERKNIQNVIVGTMSTDLSPPRKRFHWNDITRVVLCNIIRLLQDTFKCSKKSKETEQEFLVRRLRSDIIPIWPDGWMRVEDITREIEKRKKKEARVNSSQDLSQIQTKTNNNNINNNSAAEGTNGKSHAQKTEPNTKTCEVETSKVWAATSQKTPTPSASPSSVIKRSSDHSINSIISASPSPPNTSQSIKIQEQKPRLSDIEKLVNSSEILKAVQQKPSLPRYNFSPIDSEKMVTEKLRPSDSSDSDCVEIVEEFNPIKTAKSLYQHNSNNKVNHSYPEPFAKKSKKHGSDDGEHETDYSKIIMGLQSLTDPKKSNQYFSQNPSIATPIAQQQQRKAESTHAIFDNTS